MNSHKDKIERVARAIDEQRERAFQEFSERCRGDPEAGLLPAHVRALDEARAAIAAMREPTEAMIVAAALDPSNQGHVSQTGTWQAMIDEALK
jgi:hypothetical protein